MFIDLLKENQFDIYKPATLICSIGQRKSEL